MFMCADIQEPPESTRCGLCLIKRFVCDRGADVSAVPPPRLVSAAMRPAASSPSLHSISCGPIGGSTYCCLPLSSNSRTKVNILWDDPFSFFPSLHSSFHPLWLQPHSRSPVLFYTPSILILPLFFLSLSLSHTLAVVRDESLPTAPFTSPEAAQMR